MGIGTAGTWQATRAPTVAVMRLESCVNAIESPAGVASVQLGGHSDRLGCARLEGTHQVGEQSLLWDTAEPLYSESEPLSQLGRGLATNTASCIPYPTSQLRTRARRGGFGMGRTKGMFTLRAPR